MDTDGPEMVCQGSFVSAIDRIIEEIKGKVKDQYSVGFLDGLIVAKKLIQKRG